MVLKLQLLEYGAPVDAVDASKGRTALHRAVKGSVMMYPLDAKVVTLLLEAGANPFCGDCKGEGTPFAVLANTNKSSPRQQVTWSLGIDCLSVLYMTHDGI